MDITSTNDSHPGYPLFEQTLNGTGYMIADLDPISRQFVAYAGLLNAPMLDVGAAFGIATLAALETGAEVIANDIDPRHLDVLHDRTPAADQPRLTLAPGAFPESIDLPANSLGGALLSRVMHFFSGDQVEETVTKLYRWLKPDGKVFVITEASIFLEKPFLWNTYQEQKAAGDRWPGFVTGIHEKLPKRAKFLPDQIHYLDPEILTRSFTEGGFEVEYAAPFERTVETPEGETEVRESVGMIARKP